MPSILNCLDEENHTVMGGNHFTFKPRQMKYFHDKGLARSIATLRANDGFIELPEEFDELAMLKEDLVAKVITPEQKETLEACRKEGINNYCQKLRSLIYNATVSLQKDIDRSGAKYDARVEATPSDLKRLEKLAKYQNAHLDEEQDKLNKFRELEKKVANTSKG